MVDKKEFSLVSEQNIPRSILSEQKLNSIIEQKNAAEIVAAMPTLDFYILVKDVGMADALELIYLAPPEKLKECMDIDGWRKFEPDVESAAVWVAALLETSDDTKLAAALEELDNEIITLWFKKAFNVYALYEDPDPIIDTGKPLVKSPEGDYLLAINEEDKFGAVMVQLLNRIYELDLVFARMLLEGALAETDSLLTEDALRFRTARMEELGFANYLDAIEIFELLDPDTKFGASPLTVTKGEQLTEGMALQIWDKGESDFLSDALKEITGDKEREAIGTSFAALANKMASVFGLTPADEEEFPKILRFTRDTVNLAIEYRSRRDTLKAAALLITVPAAKLFRIGYTLIRNRFLHLKPLMQQMVFGDNITTPFILDEPYAIFHTFLSDRLPILADMNDPNPETSIRNFKSVRDLESADKIIEEIDLLAFMFSEALRFDIKDFKYDDKVTCSSIFATRLALWLLDEGSYALKIRPMETNELVPALKKMYAETDGKALSDLVDEGCEKIFYEPLKKIGDVNQDAAQRIAKRFLFRIANETQALNFEEPINPKYINCFWLS